MAEIKYGMGKTINLGNYENVKIEASLEVSCEDSQIEEKWEEVKEFVHKKIEEAEFQWRV
jgi:hypothetical protein